MTINRPTTSSRPMTALSQKFLSPNYHATRPGTIPLIQQSDTSRNQKTTFYGKQKIYFEKSKA